MSDNYMLSTSDNPFNPFTHYNEWYKYDMQMGYNTPGKLARYTTTSDTLSDADQEHAVNLAIDEIIELNDTGVEGVNYIRFYEE